MTADLQGPCSCSVYQFWSEWLRSTDRPAAVLQLDGRDPVKYFNATAANRYRYATKHGYSAYEISWTQRNEFLDDIHAVNTSLSIRQGVPMRQSYLDPPAQSSDSKQCPHHYATFIAAFKDNSLVGYISTNFCGHLAAASQIIGHGDHLKNGLMLVLWHEFVKKCQDRNCQTVVYSRWKDGTDGLRYWKHSVGMSPSPLFEKM